MKNSEYEIAICDMKMCLELIRLENNAAEREQQMGYWLSDHAGAIGQLQMAYDEAKSRAEIASL